MPQGRKFFLGYLQQPEMYILICVVSKGLLSESEDSSYV
jgi:hypothetical protein